MGFAGRENYFTYYLAAFFVLLSLCLAGCSADVEAPSADAGASDSFVTEVPSADTDLSDRSAEEGPPEPSDPVDPIVVFEQDPYTTEFVIDHTLAQAVRENQGLPDDTPLTEELAATVTELDGTGIRTLTGISHFTSLEWLFISETDCQDIQELTRIPSLISVYISRGYITEIPDFSDCPNLTELQLPVNCVTDVTPLCKATSLRFVNLSDNDISSVAPLKDVAFLEGLCLEGNGIIDYAAIRDNQMLCQALDAASQSPVTYALEVEERAKSIVQEQTDDLMTQETKLAKLYAYILDHVVYDVSPHQNRPFGYQALCNGKGACGEYAEALCLLARHAGLTCRVVITETHAFDAVELEGEWYLLDPTWDDSIEGTPTDARNWEYFGFTTETALADPDHIYDTKRYPVSERAPQWVIGVYGDRPIS